MRVVFCAFIACTILKVGFLSVEGAMKLTSGRRLDGMLVYISENVPERGGDLMKNIKSIISGASRALYDATSNMAPGKSGVSYGDVYITVPKSWNEVAKPITWQQCVKSEVKVVTNELNGNTDEPFTKQLGKCGDPGDHSRFTDSFFNARTEKQRDVKGRQFMREFAKLRYGVFSEEPLNRVLYVFKGSQLIQSSCPVDVHWEINTKEPIVCSDKNKVCNYKIKTGSTHNYSVIFDPETPSSRFFCNDDSMPHNKRARSLQNKRCKGQSIAGVILKHKDFYGEHTSAEYKPPTFHILKDIPRKIAIVLDISGSMYPVTNQTKKALAHFIKYTIEAEAQVGIVTFNDEAQIVSPLLTMDEHNKTELLKKINDLLVFGATNIGDGLMKGAEILGGDIFTDDQLYGTIILVSDGESNENTSIDYPPAIDNVIRKGIVTYTISYGDIADPHLNRLSKKTGGMFLYAPVSSSESEIFNKFAARRSCDPVLPSMKKVKEGKTRMNLQSTITNFTYIDKFMGTNTKIDVDIPLKFSKDIFHLIDPHSILIDATGRSMNKRTVTITFQIRGKPAVGMYKLRRIPYRDDRNKRSIYKIPIKYRISWLTSQSSYIPSGSLSSTFISLVDASTSVTMTVDLSGIELSGFTNVSVTVQVKNPRNWSWTLVMTDGGWGDDSIEGDGIFTRTIYARDFTEPGFYQFQGRMEMTSESNGEKIEKLIDMESVRVMEVPKNPVEDVVPPARIPDLEVLSFDSRRRFLKLQFSAPGDDSTTGRIGTYEVRVDSQREVIMAFQESVEAMDVVVHELLIKNLDTKNGLKISIRGVDPAGNKGSWSQWVLVR